jgi:hypothetical protein
MFKYATLDAEGTASLSLQALSPDFDVDLDADPGDVAARVRQARREP